MLPLSIFAQRQFAAVNAVSFIVYAALTGATFLLPVTLQVVSGYSPLGSGRRGDAAISEQCLHCGLDAPPLTTTTGQTAGTE